MVFLAGSWEHIKLRALEVQTISKIELLEGKTSGAGIATTGASDYRPAAALASAELEILALNVTRVAHF